MQALGRERQVPQGFSVDLGEPLPIPVPGRLSAGPECNRVETLSDEELGGQAIPPQEAEQEMFRADVRMKSRSASSAAEKKDALGTISEFHRGGEFHAMRSSCLELPPVFLGVDRPMPEDRSLLTQGAEEEVFGLNAVGAERAGLVTGEEDDAAGFPV